MIISKKDYIQLIILYHVWRMNVYTKVGESMKKKLKKIEYDKSSSSDQRDGILTHEYQYLL